jgi:hypothetical protein
MDLAGPRRYFHWSANGWRILLTIAIHLGWEPLGTGYPRGQGRSRQRHANYFGNDGQLVYARDARNLADVLELFLKLQRRGKLPVEKRGEWFWSREGKIAVRKFIAFCRRGSFRIY